MIDIDTFSVKGQKRILPTESQERKAVPLYRGLIRYFPDALVAVAEVSAAGNRQHLSGEPLRWDRTKSTDELDALTRHLFEVGTLDSDGMRHSAKVAWRALANLQKEIESGITEIERNPSTRRQDWTNTAVPICPRCGYGDPDLAAVKPCADKHTPTPSPEDIAESVASNVLNTICEAFESPTSKEDL